MIKGRGERQKPGYEVPQLPLMEPLESGLYSESKGGSLKGFEVWSATGRLLTAGWEVDERGKSGGLESSEVAVAIVEIRKDEGLNESMRMESGEVLGS